MEYSSSNLFLILFLGLVVFRMSLLLVVEEGMFLIFERIRMFFGVYYVSPKIVNQKQVIEEVDNKKVIQELKEYGATNYIVRYRNELSKLFSCVWCMSVWVSFVVTLIWFLTYDVPLDINFVFTVFAVSGTAIIIKEVL